MVTKLAIDPERRAATNRRYYVRRKLGLTNQQIPKLEDQPPEIQTKILELRAKQQKTPKEFYRKIDKDYCEVCGDKSNLVRHHIKYTPIEETIIVCKYCHSLIHNRNLLPSKKSQETQREKWARQKREQRLRNKIESGEISVEEYEAIKSQVDPLSNLSYNKRYCKHKSPYSKRLDLSYIS